MFCQTHQMSDLWQGLQKMQAHSVLGELPIIPVAHAAQGPSGLLFVNQTSLWSGPAHSNWKKGAGVTVSIHVIPKNKTS